MPNGGGVEVSGRLVPDWMGDGASSVMRELLRLVMVKKELRLKQSSGFTGLSSKPHLWS